MALVLKNWTANKQPDDKGRYVDIKARESGLISYLLSLLGIDPTVSMVVDSRNFLFEEGSWAGFRRRVIPLQHISSMFYGYHKPWKSAAGIAAGAFVLSTAIGAASPKFALVVLLLGLIAAVVYYVLNKELQIGVVEQSGFSAAIAFKRSAIEGKSIDEHEAELVIEILRDLIESNAKH